MNRVILVLAAGALFAQAQQPPKLQALIITGQNRHDWRATTPLLRQMLEQTGRFEVRVSEEFRGATAALLAAYDLAIINYFDQRKPELRWGDATDRALESWVAGGKGLVIYHFSAAAFDGWTEYEKMCAGNWRPNQGHHSPPHDFEVVIKDMSHPITRGLKSFLQRSDELYANLKWQPEGSYHVLATAWDDHARYQGKARQPVPGPGLHHPMLWTVDYGKGRVFATALGHDVPALQNEGFAATFVRGAEWAATGSVTIPLPAALVK